MMSSKLFHRTRCAQSAARLLASTVSYTLICRFPFPSGPKLEAGET